MPATELLAVIDRDGFVESEHRGVAALVDPDGRVLEAHGPVDRPFLARSALKPLFAAALLDAGLIELEPAHAALASASHWADDEHVTTARAMAAAHGVDEDALRCPPMKAPDGTQRRFAHMCVGKHIAMAASARAMGAPEEYWADAHPIEAVLRSSLAEATGEPISGFAHDGCGALVFPTTPVGLARAFRRLAPDGTGGHRAVGDAMRAHPTLIDGAGRPDAVVIAATGCATKFGAEGTQAIVAPDGTTAVVKSADGARRPGAPVALALLERAGAIPAGTLESLAEPLGLIQKSADEPVGRLSVVV
ncbi:asparaginase [Agrococcus sp. SCSIO52902]|uniref:asparaginase n=1 Tax=Agrococcus sp. SCSIO52902 TaxID=2933290 RepID=UPI001FF43113|nr:asparaginase [Agrococcus sp. SCSIO52902]UOW01390.1 asparaginase [Agrococcus sp. SCSIO52902]